MKALIQKLSEMMAPSGHEEALRAFLQAEIEPWADEIQVDALGNLIARRGVLESSRRKVMLAAHMDEIGVIASHIEKNGFIRFLPVGSVNPLTLPGSRVKFSKGSSGVIGWESGLEAGRAPTLEQMYIDVGAGSAEDCPVKLGDTAAFDRPFFSEGSRLIGKAMDNRVGVAVLMETLRRLAAGEARSEHTLYFVFTVQEEVETRGAQVAAYALQPDLGFSVDVTPSGDTPQGRRTPVRLGQGPAIKVREQGMISSPQVVEWVTATAERQGINLQRDVAKIGYTDARAIHLSAAGVPATSLAVPCRYVHTPSEMVDLEDVLSMVDLVCGLLGEPLPSEVNE